MMERFAFTEASLPGVRIITPFYDEDVRGCFLKSYEQTVFKEHGIFFQPYEGFYTRSQKGTVRGLHFQRSNCQDKLVQVLHGAAYDVVVDLRENSEHFGHWEGFYLSAENRNLLYIPKGFAHGFLALAEDTLFSYLCGDRYDPETDGGIRWDDPQLAIDWPLERVPKVIVSNKDQQLPIFKDFVEKYGALRSAE